MDTTSESAHFLPVGSSESVTDYATVQSAPSLCIQMMLAVLYSEMSLIQK